MDVPQKRPPIVTIAIIVAALLAVLALFSAVLSNPVVATPTAIIATVGVFGLKRRNPWAGYGLALFLCCSTAARVFAALRLGSVQNPRFLVAAIVPLAVAAFAFLAGTALASQGPRTHRHRLAWLVLAATPLGLSFFFNLLIIPTGSMEPTLLTGDNIVMRRADAASFRRGDLVVYREPNKQSIFVKRIAAVGGDRIHLKNKALYVNGQAVNEPYARHNTSYLDQYRDNFPLGDINVPLYPHMQEQLQQQVRDSDFLVPAGTFFVLGDNRDSSLDSRYSGVIPAAAVIGKPWLVCFSADLPVDASVSRPAVHNVLVRARWNRLLKPL